jgi:hypothetical protein
MSANTKIFQLYFKSEQVSHLDPLFTPYDNTANPRPELREWYIWDKEHGNVSKENLDYWGYVSWKFKEKSNLTGQDVFDHINNNPGYEVYLFNPCIVNEALFVNNWEQGDNYHPRISEIGNTFLAKIGYEDIDVKTMLLDRTRTVFANYVVGNQRFWREFMAFSRRIFAEAKTDAAFEDRVFGAGHSKYAYDPSLPMFTFLIERLIPTFLDLEGFNVCPYVYTDQTLPNKYRPFANDIRILSDLKTQINKHDSDELYNIWNYLRWDYLNKNPNIIHLE